MAKEKAKKEAKKTDGSEGNPRPWVEPFPADEKNEKGKLVDPENPVFVRATVKQDLILSGVKLAAGGVYTIPASIAHAHGAVLGPPPKDDKVPKVAEESEDATE